MLRSRLLVPLALVTAAPFLLAACGGDDSSQDEDDITAAIEQAATTDTAENCTEVQTVAFTAQTEFTSEEEAVATCEGNAGEDEPAGESVEVENIEVDGDSATAEASFTGGGLDGQGLAISLVKEDDQWKLDSLDEFVSFDQAAFTGGLIEGATESGAAPEVVDCVEQALNDSSEEELQEVYLSGDEQQLVGLFGNCFGGA